MGKLPHPYSYIDSRGSLVHFVEEVSESIHCVTMASRDAEGEFRAGVHTRPFASAQLLRFDVPNLIMTRASTDVGRDECRDVQLTYVISGETIYRQYGRECVVHTHDCFLFDYGSPFELSNSAHARGIGIRIPREWCSRHFQAEEVAGRRIDASSYWGATLSAYLRALYAEFESAPSLSPSLMIDQALQLVELSLAGQKPEGTTTHQKGLLRRTRSIMRDLCHEEDLTPASVASKVGISRGYMNKLFAQDGTTFCRELDALRIDRATALLESMSLQYLTINEIGTKCGLPNPSHFAHKFRSLKGVSPSQYRRSTR